MSLVESHRPSCPKRRLDKPYFAADGAMFNDLKGNEEQFQEIPHAELLIQGDISKITMVRKRFAIRAAGPSQECRTARKTVSYVVAKAHPG
ncbi:hypothetical protein BHYA_0342g00010 [Botrytis hyacinthi]|uniref:Uncharacterized protein n=1 Tax=Botrytis hyacinthi TaxID=278943 RepID=A0A4Z1G9U8_9HELO|nr:hypothetical protein BHYA_0342g00010 [Botrytis hyacinthi]